MKLMSNQVDISSFKFHSSQLWNPKTVLLEINFSTVSLSHSDQIFLQYSYNVQVHDYYTSP